GQVTAEDQAKIPFQPERPLVLRSRFQEEVSFDDLLGLEKRVDEKLRTLSTRGRDAPLVFVEASEFPDAFRLSGRYRLEENKVTVLVNVFQGSKMLAGLSVTGDKRQL